MDILDKLYFFQVLYEIFKLWEGLNTGKTVANFAFEELGFKFKVYCREMSSLVLLLLIIIEMIIMQLNCSIFQRF